MVVPPVPINEKERLAELVSLNILDSPAEPNFDIITEHAAMVFNVPIAVISLVDGNRQWFKSTVGLEVTEAPRSTSFCGHAICEDDIFVIPDATLDPRFADNPMVTGEPHIRFYAGAQLFSSEGYVLGTVCIVDTVPRAHLSLYEKTLLKQLARIAISQIEMFRWIGLRNKLSGLPNRRQLQLDLDILTSNPGSETPHVTIAADVMDPTRFDDLVQTLGHTYSDAFTLTMARILRAVVPERVKLYQIESYRFAFVLCGGDSEFVEDWIDRIELKLAEPINCINLPIKADVRIGVARFPQDTRSGSMLLRAAISALHDARDRKVVWCNYSSDSDQADRRAFQLLSDLPVALKDPNQIELHYQPKIDLLTGTCLGAEALLRWRHPLLGMVPPAEFVALAERTELMGRITEWVIHSALKQLAAWIEADRQVLTLAVNISVHDLDNDDFAGCLAGLLKQYDVPPKLLELEVTESALMADPLRAKKQLDRIRALGVTIAIDDFGTGQSSLFYMKHIPANVVKIDQVFVRALTSDSDDQRIVNSMMDLAHGLGCRVIAEGIETPEVLDWLATHGCNEGQGFGISRPLEATAFDSWLLGWRPSNAISKPTADAIAS